VTAAMATVMLDSNASVEAVETMRAAIAARPRKPLLKCEAFLKQSCSALGDQ
jgi:hypothetical protein